MKIAVASGKGGTGKTTVAVNLAHVLSRNGRKVCYADCDVEEPNGHLFLRPAIKEKSSVHTPVPAVDESRCAGCGTCAEICQYNAVAKLGDTAVVFPELCHGCGGCAKACPSGAIIETTRNIGILERGPAGKIYFVHGRLNIGEAMSPPLIREVRRAIPPRGLAVVDAPPGTSCPAVSAVEGADFVLLVTEPTPFGLHDLGLALEMTRALSLPHAVVINRHQNGNNRAREFCRARGASILAEIPDDRRIAAAYSRGEIIVEKLPAYTDVFRQIWDRIRKTGGR